MNSGLDNEGGPGEEDGIEDESVFTEREVTECFSIFDHRGTGLIPSKFLGKALQSLGIFLTQTEMEDLLTKFDKEGFVELLDFTTYASGKLIEMDTTKILGNAFNAFDLEKEGALPTDRFKKWMTTLGDPLTESEAKELCRIGDPNNKGIFAYADAIPRLLN